MDNKVEVEVKRITLWNRALNAARITVGKKPLKKEPSNRWKAEMILSQHSPIRLVEYDIKITNIKQWITTHLVRHWLGWIPFVHSQRDDRREYDCTRDELPQGSLNDAQFSSNAQSLINISQLRLCGQAAKETREVWKLVKEKVSEQDPILADKMQPRCVWYAFCPERKCCGYINTDDWKINREKLMKRDYPENEEENKDKNLI